MTTSVVNPFAFSEISRIRAHVRARPQVDSIALARVRRDLFGPVDHEDSRKFVMRELASQQSKASDRWGFDFERGIPLKHGPYVWEKVTKLDCVPSAYSHSYTIITESITITEDPDVSAVAPTPPASPLEAASSTCLSSTPPEVETARPTVSVKVSTPPSIKRSSSLKFTTKRRRVDQHQQKKMTDFLRIRKPTSATTDGAKLAKLRRLSEPVTAPRKSLS